MKHLQKYIYVPFFVVVLILLSLFAVKNTDTQSPAPTSEILLPQFQIQNTDATKTETISLFDAKDGNYYVFLPSYANWDQITLSLPAENRFSLGNTVLSDGMNCSGFQYDHQRPGKLHLVF